MRLRTWLPLFFSSAGVILATLVWIFFAPVSLGGGAAYVMITGNSMEPGFTTGDLVLVRPADTYQVGDAVTYFNAELERYVFHRITAFSNGRFTLRGDNNDWDDPYQPAQAEIVGAFWLRLAGAGKIIEALRQPWAAVLVVLLSGGLIAAMFIRNKKAESQTNSLGLKQRALALLAGLRQPGGSKPPRPASPSNRPGGIPEWLPDLAEPAVFILGFLTLASLVLGFFAFLNPLEKEKTDFLPYQQIGVFAYSAETPAGLYDARQLVSGAPIFTKINCAVDLQFTYILSAPDLGPVSGTSRLTAELSDPSSGWSRTFPLGQAVPFNEATFTSSGRLDFCRLQATAAEVEAQTGVTPNLYLVSVRPEIQLESTLAGLPLTASFNPELRFQLDRLHAFILSETEGVDPLRPTRDDLLEVRYTAANSLRLFGIGLDVRASRIVSAVVLLLSLACLAALGWLVNRAAQRDPAALYKLKYGALLVDVRPGLRPAALHAVDVASMDDLARLAERSNAVILHEASAGQHIYTVEGEQLSYRFSEMISAVPAEPQELVSWLNLKRAVERGEFKVFYQPIVSLTDESITAVEALLRWQHPQSGLISARDFIAAAESTGMIDTIGEWMLHTACAQVGQWRADGHAIRLSVNFSRRQLEKAPDEIIDRVLRQTGMSASALQIEIPAAGVLERTAEILPGLQRLKALGVHLSMDGYAGEGSLADLAGLPLDSIKIDRLVVEKFHQPEDAEYISGLITAAMNKGLNVVAEGVETEPQMAFLRSKLCAQAQGYLFARPAPAEEITTLLKEPSSDPGQEG